MGVRFRVLPQSATFLDVFAELGDIGRDSVDILSEMLGAFPAEREAISPRLTALHRRGGDAGAQILSRLLTSFITPYDRGDIQDLAFTLTRCLDRAEAVGDLTVLYRVGPLPAPAIELLGLLSRLSELTQGALRQLSRPRDLSEYWVEVDRLGLEAGRCHRRAMAEILDSRQETPTMLRHRDVVTGLAAVAEAFTEVAHCVQTIAVKES